MLAELALYFYSPLFGDKLLLQFGWEIVFSYYYFNDAVGASDDNVCDVESASIARKQRSSYGPTQKSKLLYRPVKYRIKWTRRGRAAVLGERTHCQSAALGQ